jgi:hypothetical protein
MKDPKVKHARLSVEQVSVFQLNPSPENTKLYRPPSRDDPAIIELANDIKANGVRQPLVISADWYIISGHSRRYAAIVAGLREVPCIRRLDIVRGDKAQASDGYIQELRRHNLQRVKTSDEVLRETLVDVNPDVAYEALTSYRKRKAKVKAKTIDLGEIRQRKEISQAREPMLRACQEIINEMQEFLPLDVRQIHYQLINRPPLRHASKPSSMYRNDKPSYWVLCDLLTRARHEGYVDYDDIDDPSRVVTVWETYTSLGCYYRDQVNGFLAHAQRNLMVTQPNHIELVVEKNTLRNLVEPIASDFGIPLSFGRGQASTPVLRDISKRYKESGKDGLIIIAASDLDPDGDAIARSIGQRLRDDFHHNNVKVIKAALTMEQVRTLKLPEKFERAKDKSPNYPRYIEEYATDFVWELEALHPRQLQKLVRDAIDSVVDHKALKAEIDQAKLDAVHIAATRKIVLEKMRELKTPDEE